MRCRGPHGRWQVQHVSGRALGPRTLSRRTSTARCTGAATYCYAVLSETRTFNNSGKKRRPCPPIGPPRLCRWPSCDKRGRSLRRRARSGVQPQGMTGSRMGRGRLFVLTVNCEVFASGTFGARQALLLKCVPVRWRASKDWEDGVLKAACDRLLLCWRGAESQY